MNFREFLVLNLCLVSQKETQGGRLANATVRWLALSASDSPPFCVLLRSLRHQMSERHDDCRQEYVARSHWSLSSHAMSRSPHRVSLSWIAPGRLRVASIEAKDEVSKEAKG